MQKIFLLFFLLTGCVNLDYREQQRQLALNVRNKDFSSAQRTINSANFYNKSGFDLIRNLEKGNICYLSQNYYQATKYFDEAKQISDELFTVSISRLLLSSIDLNYDIYYGEEYEKSLIRFYQSLNNFLLYKSEKYLDLQNKEIILTEQEKRNFLFSARANIIEWDSLLNSYKSQLLGKKLYKDDLLAKIWGGIVHEEINTNEDKQIALQLYKDAKQVLFKNYNLYPSFNKKYEKFSDNYDKLPKLTPELVKEKFIEETNYSSQLNTFLDNKITKLQQNKKDNLIIVLKDELITQKKVKIINIPLMNVLSNINNQDINFFVLNTLFLQNNFKLELPYIELEKNNKQFEIIVYADNKKIIQQPIVLINPLSEIAFNDIEYENEKLRLALVTKAVMAYVSAIMGAYEIYQQDPSVFGILQAQIYYSGMIKLITSSVDTRQWATLPKNIRLTELLLNKGDYTINIIEKSNNNVIYKQNITITEDANIIDLNL